jgi:hypothetical protein
MIDEVTRTVVDHLIAATADRGSTWVEITSLEANGTLTADKLHVCLYAIEEAGHLRNQPLVATDGGYQRPPIALRLQYVMTYQGGTHLDAQQHLNRVIQVFHSTPILSRSALRPALLDRTEQLTVRLRTPTADERNQIWTAFNRPAKLSLYYEVDVALVPLLAHEGAGRIEAHRIDYSLVRG